MTDKLSLYLRQLDSSDQEREEPLDTHLIRLYMRDWNLHINKNRITKNKQK